MGTARVLRNVEHTRESKVMEGHPSYHQVPNAPINAPKILDGADCGM
jgi:hypothetical protein